MADIEYQITLPIEKACNELAERYKRTLKEAGKNATGELVNSVDVVAEFQGHYMIISYMLADHWKYVENGRRAGAKMPPIDKIENWIKVKRIVPRSINGKVPSTRQLAFVIARSIAEKGIPATKALERTIDSAYNIIDDIIAELYNQVTAFIAQLTEDISDI